MLDQILLSSEALAKMAYPSRCLELFTSQRIGERQLRKLCTPQLGNSVQNQVKRPGALTRNVRNLAISWLGASCATACALTCWESAAERHGVSATLLYAIARTESNLDPRALNMGHRARTGSYDIGLMQINSGHLPRLAQLGIDEAALFDACTNLHVGAWLLAELFGRFGVAWEAVGAYNASCTALKGAACIQARMNYAWKVYRNLPASNPGMADSPSVEPRIAAYLGQEMAVRVAP
jgi:soluble lytic murein transglycosylase-like protein